MQAIGHEQYVVKSEKSKSIQTWVVFHKEHPAACCTRAFGLLKFFFTSKRTKKFTLLWHTQQFGYCYVQ